MVDFGGCSDSRDLAVYHRARPSRVPSALLQAQSNGSVAKTWSGLERSDQKK